MKSTVPLLCLALFWALAALSPASARELTYSNFFPPTHAQSALAEQWCREVERRTGGEVSFTYFPGQTLTQADQSFDAVQSGICDVAMSCLAYTRGRFPVMQVVDLPLGYTSGLQATRVANRVFRRLRPAELSGVEVMYLHAHGPGLLHTTGRPVRSLADLKGMKLRAHGAIAEMVRALGAAPVTMPMPEAYQALDRGMVDGAFYPVEANQGWKLGQVSRFCTRSFPAAYTTSFFVVMNRQAWAALSPPAQEAIREVNAEWADRHGRAWDRVDARGREYLLAQEGRQVVELAPGQAAKWRAAVEPVIQSYAAKLDSQGLDGSGALAAARRALAESAP
jgi:TRAP-type C4-dicarboxylate transport system substrate-binding protein